MIHTGDGELRFQPYTPHGDAIFSIAVTRCRTQRARARIGSGADRKVAIAFCLST
jgi:hypothetical protein